jgi:hypothetical protein
MFLFGGGVLEREREREKHRKKNHGQERSQFMLTARQTLGGM